MHEREKVGLWNSNEEEKMAIEYEAKIKVAGVTMKSMLDWYVQSNITCETDIIWKYANGL